MTATQLHTSFRLPGFTYHDQSRFDDSRSKTRRLWQFSIVSKRRRGTVGDEKRGVWMTLSWIWLDSRHRLFINTTTITLLLIPRVVFIFKDCVARADMFAAPQKSAWFDNARVLKTDPCRPNKTPTTKHKHEQRTTNISDSRSSYWNITKISFYYFN